MSNPEEFIGQRIKVVQARNTSIEGTEGTIKEDTKNTFRILTDDNKAKILLKQGAVFMINKQKIRGEDLLFRPEERIKLKNELKKIKRRGD
ncbi:hypothetical protein AYK26_03235 [Euryarchaeota archaeon SM23-78]|nr:MAG: hypothetical protein AYK26_03235 [Euryarchaeota archaeon SM23-78]